MKHEWQEIHAGGSYAIEWCPVCGSLKDYEYDKPKKSEVIQTPSNSVSCSNLKKPLPAISD